MCRLIGFGVGSGYRVKIKTEGAFHCKFFVELCKYDKLCQSKYLPKTLVSISSSNETHLCNHLV